MEEFFEILMSSYTIQADQLELSLAKMIENWDLDELETILTTSKGV
jgi:hypothetical protein